MGTSRKTLTCSQCGRQEEYTFLPSSPNFNNGKGFGSGIGAAVIPPGDRSVKCANCGASIRHPESPESKGEYICPECGEIVEIVEVWDVNLWIMDSIGQKCPKCETKFHPGWNWA